MSAYGESTGQRETERFAAALESLRQENGAPSFRALAARSGCISHSTLHEATKGSRMPTWETTREFVAALGVEPGPWRERWESAAERIREERRARGSLAVPCPSETEPEPTTPTAVPAAGPAPESGEGTSAGGESVIPGEPAADGDSAAGRPRPSGSARRWAAAAAAFLLLFGVGVVVGRVTAHSHGSAGGPAVIDGYRASYGTADRVFVHEGDFPGTVEDVTLPDGSLVASGETVDKVWRISNAGSVDWVGRSMVRITPKDAAGAECQTPLEVPVPNTAPGEVAEVTVPVTMYGDPGGVCRVEWKMVDADGTSVFPKHRPLYLLLYAE